MFSISYWRFIGLFSAYSLLAFNGDFLQAFLGDAPLQQFKDGLFAGTIVGMVFAIQVLFCLLVMWRYTTKPIAILLLLGNAGALYFMQQFQVVIDQSMLENVFVTDLRETSDLLNPKLFSYLIVLGLLPSLVLLRVTIRYPSLPREVITRVIAIIGILGLIGLGVFVQFKDFSTHFRLHKHDQRLWVPRNYLWGLYQSAAGVFARDDTVILPIGTDAQYTPDGQPRLVVIVVGETARAMNFGLYGYGRETNPRLARENNLIVLPPTQACGTSTRVSVPCMFSALDRVSYADRGGRPETFPALFQRLGIDSSYIGNNFGDCKDSCAGIQTTYTHQKFDQSSSAFCNAFECHDEILVGQLAERLENTPLVDSLIILHQNGSHGPRYDKRVPTDFARFLPICTNADIRQCSQQELINGYDNTIVYTDHVLSELIATLKADPRPSLLMYLSDHGESLGENGLYLHGMPYAFAPKEQTEVPFLIWTSDAYRAAFPFDTACVAGRGEYRHANLFHTLSGLFGVQMAEYDPTQDIFAGC